MHGRTLILCACAMALWFAAGAALAQDPVITIFLSSSSGVIGQDSVELSVYGANYGPSINVDVHFAIVAPNGTIYEIPGWATDFTPLLSNMTLPEWFMYGPAVLGVYGVGDFPLNSAGDYLFAAAFAEPGTLRFIGDISFASFRVSEQGTSQGSSGAVQLCWTKSYSTYTQDWSTYVSAGGSFAEYFETEKAVPLAGDECQVTTVDWHEDGDGNARWLDAGEKLDMLGGPLGDVELPKWAEMGVIFYGHTDELQEGHYAGGNTYTFVGYGGPDVGSFDVSVVAPETIDLYEPQLETAPVINRSQNLNVSWNGTGYGQLYVNIMAYDIDMEAMQPRSISTCSCVFDDDGQAQIPASILSQMPASAGIYGMLMPQFTAFRSNNATFQASGLTLGGTAMASASTGGSVELQ